MRHWMQQTWAACLRWLVEVYIEEEGEEPSGARVIRLADYPRRR